MKTALISLALILCMAQGQGVSDSQTQLVAMEKKFFEHDFSKEPMDYRLSRLEKFVFGDTMTGDADSRLNKLSGVVDLHTAMIPPDASPTPKPAPVADENRYPHVTELEKQLLRHTFEGDGLPTRLARLETVAFGAAQSANSDLAARTDALEEYVERRSGRRAVAQEQPVEIAPTPPPPEVLADEPPLDARMLTRVAWCEQHVFGHTFPNLHLLERLHQLNAELFPRDREPDARLMDRVDIMVKQVVMRQHPPVASANITP